jgi:hypothetical protein
MWEKIKKEGLETLGRFYGLYYGIVQSVDDPVELNRILVKVPEVKGPIGVPIWALPRGLYGGTGYGIQCLPEVGEYVIVSFRQGDPKAPYWEHAHYAVEQKPEDFKEPHIKGLVTPKGIKVLIDDNEESVTVSTPSGVLFEIKGEQVSIQAAEIYLNADDKDEPILKGGETENLLKDILGYLSDLCEAFTKDVAQPGTIGAMAPQTAAKTVELITTIQARLLEVPQIKSDRNFGS